MSVLARDDTITAAPQAWLAERPAPRCRSGREIGKSLPVIVRLSGCGDPAVEALAKGGYFAAFWVSEQTSTSPARGLELSCPCLSEIADEIEAAGKVATGAVRLPGSDWCDEARIAGRGMEEWLAWVFIAGYPTPLWLEQDATPQLVRSGVLRRVGLMRPGLLGPGASRERFTYDVADLVPGAGQR
jgi:hypothetical protein